jgi:hypothetical protein
MKRICELPQGIQDELRRLDEQLVQALLAKDEVTIITCRLLWAETYLRSGGIHRGSLPHLTAAVDDTLRSVITARERWKQEKRARPLILVVTRKQLSWVDSSGAEHSYYRETLACGHSNDFVIFWQDEKPARRRRCKQCGRAIVNELRVSEPIQTARPSPQTTSRGALRIRPDRELPANVVIMPARAVAS